MLQVLPCVGGGSRADEISYLRFVRSPLCEIIELLRTEGDRWVHWVEQLPETFLSEPVRLPDGKSVSRFEMLLGTKEHEMEHRAQLTVIQRLLGLVPHFTRNLPISRDKAA